MWKGFATFMWEAAERLMAMLGYTHGDEGIFIKPGEAKNNN